MTMSYEAYAFPWTKTIDGSLPHQGMTLRDYFAAKAMQGLLAADVERVLSFERSSEIAYKHADAMLAERNKT
jgi:hypothetical protein